MTLPSANATGLPIESPRARRVFAPLMLSAALGALTTAAQAQEPPATRGTTGQATRTDDTTGAQTLDAVTVSATRRREPVREVPIQINTMPADALEKSGAASLTDYLAIQPGVDVKAEGAGRGAINVRGVSTGDQTIATVGVYIDDIPFGSSTAYLLGSTLQLDLDLLDLSHLELLRGPQGTLYGAGAMGGVLQYVTREPDPDQFSGKISLFGSGVRNGKPNGGGNFVVNVPLSEGVAAARISGFDRHDGGYIDATGPAAGRDVNGGSSTGGRASVLLEPSSQLKVRLSATGQDIRRRGSDDVDYDFASGRPVAGDRTRVLSAREPYTVKIGLVGADVEYTLPWARFNSITSGQSIAFVERIDDSFFAPLLGLANSTVPQDNSVTSHKQTQEFRLTSTGKGPVQWLAGYYFDHEAGASTQLINVILPDGSSGPNLGTIRLPSSYIEHAVYGDVTWNVTDRLAATGGLRYSRNRQYFEQIGSGLLVGPPSDIVGTSQESSRTYLATVRYLLTPTSSVYLRAASGYRPGGPNAVLNDPVSGQPLAPTTFKHDTLWSYEAGYKADLLDRKATVQASLFNILWKQIQNASAVNGVSVIVNDGHAHIKGAELAATLRPVTSLNLSASAAYIDARATDSIPNQVIAGSRLPNSARFSGTLAATYSYDVAGYAAYTGVTERIAGQRNSSFDGDVGVPNYKLPGYAMTDLQAGFSFGRFDVALYCRNVFDRNAQLNAATAFVPLGGSVLVIPSAPRTIGAVLTANY